ncbi:MAG: methyl-accepting chemotaxis protein [Clostridiales bacterium]|nr:methyl-accepting chemotaxis protein [Clostridiales bacterium]
MKLRGILIAVFSTVCLLAMAILALVSGSMLFTQTQKKMEYQMQKEANELSGSIDAWMNGKLEATSNLAAFMGENMDLTSTAEQLHLILQSPDYQGSVSDLYVGTTDGKMIDGSFATFDASYDPRERVWYQLASVSDRAVITEAYVDNTTKKLCVSVAKAIQSSQGEQKGVVAMDILLDTITEKVNETVFGKTGQAFLVDETGVFLANQEEALLNTSISEQADMKNLSEELLGNENGILSYKQGNSSRILVYKK